jgi:tRNA(Arg) A34 adenosine deaminase TadA
VVEEFERQVERQVERLQRGTLRQMETQVAERRIRWFVENYPQAGQAGTPSPRRAYELLLLDYLGLDEEQVPVRSETEDEIVWSSVNDCATLAACERLGLDTRQVCRAVYEKSTQALISQLDPQLRFYRSYQEIRPHAQACVERIVRLDFERTMRTALKEARASQDEGNMGYGAVVALGEQVLAKAHDTVITEGDPSLHAEVNAIRQAVRAFGDRDLRGAVLFSTCEPCPMCSALAVWANLTSIVYGVSIQETARLGRSRILIGAREVVERSPTYVEVIGGVLEDECRQLYA